MIQKTDKRVVVLLILAVVVLFGVGSYLFLTRGRSAPSANLHLPEQSSAASQNLQGVKQEAENGSVVYENAVLGFRVTLPESFDYSSVQVSSPSLGTEEHSVIFIPAGRNEPVPGTFRILVRIRPNVEGRDATAWAAIHPFSAPDLPSLKQTLLLERKSIILDGFEALEQFEQSSSEAATEAAYLHVVYAVRGGKLYGFEALAKDKMQYEQFRLAFRAFLDTFQFL